MHKCIHGVLRQIIHFSSGGGAGNRLYFDPTILDYSLVS